MADPESDSIERYRGNGDGHWVLHFPEADEALQLASVDIQLTGAVIFEDAEPGWPPTAANGQRLPGGDS